MVADTPCKKCKRVRRLVFCKSHIDPRTGERIYAPPGRTFCFPVCDYCRKR
jgi:hypothetical protein